MAGGGLTKTKSTSESARIAAITAASRRGSRIFRMRDVARANLRITRATKTAVRTPWPRKTNASWSLSTTPSLLATRITLSVPGGT